MLRTLGSQGFFTLVLVSVLGVSQGFLFSHRNQTAKPIPTVTSTIKSANPIPTETSTIKSVDHEWETNPVKAEAGTIAGAIFGVLVCVIVVGTVGMLYIRRKRRQNAEYRRQLHIRETCAESAGVYMETTSNQNIYKPTNTGTKNKYTSLRKDRKDPNLVESDSEDELWTK